MNDVSWRKTGHLVPWNTIPYRKSVTEFPGNRLSAKTSV